ncbi:MAG: RidA family protein [Bacteroidota bacterium]
MEWKRTRISSSAPWESTVGYSRAIKIGPFLEIAGTTAIDNGNVVAPGDAYEQTRFILKKIKSVIEEAGGKMEDTIRTRMFVTNIQDWEAIGKAHGEFFGAIRPAATMVEVKGLIDPALVVEIEVSAFVH